MISALFVARNILALGAAAIVGLALAFPQVAPIAAGVAVYLAILALMPWKDDYDHHG